MHDFHDYVMSVSKKEIIYFVKKTLFPVCLGDLSKKSVIYFCYYFYGHHHQSRLTSWGRSTLQLQRSVAMSRATSAEVLVTISTCRTQVCLGHPGRRFQCGLLSGRPPPRVSTASRIAIRPGASSGSRRTCPKTTSRHLRNVTGEILLLSVLRLTGHFSIGYKMEPANSGDASLA